MLELFLRAQVTYEATEWEMDKLEAQKMAAEAEADDDADGLVFDSWDQSAANQVYRKQVSPQGKLTGRETCQKLRVRIRPAVP